MVTVVKRILIFLKNRKIYVFDHPTCAVAAGNESLSNGRCLHFQGTAGTAGTMSLFSMNPDWLRIRTYMLGVLKTLKEAEQAFLGLSSFSALSTMGRPTF